ncbi:MAG TPA: hypothetical protein VEK57_29950 [Thermoanaerobaculia bacterium]|nr:hypothetical protein [Thermoanaerobaculia bacterium]
MRTRRRALVASLAVAFSVVATASLAGAAAPAQAYYLKNTDLGNFHSFLRFPPKHPSFRPCISNTVTLRPGDYVHGAYIVSQRHRTNPDLENETLRVRARTTYNWEVCRGWNDDIGSGRYQVRSRLVRRGFSRSALMTFENEIGGRSYLYGNGNYEWGGRIERACFDCTEPSG